MMRPPRGFLIAAALLLLALAGAWRWRLNFSPRALPAAAATHPATHPNVARPAASPRPGSDTISAREMTLSRLAYAQAWTAPQPPAFAAFREWTQRFLATAPTGRATLTAEGVALARARRPELLALIKTDPARALALAVPAVIRAALPPVVLAELETRVAGRGDFALLAAVPQPGEPAPAPLRRIAFLDGVTYTAHAYGRRDGQLTKEGASLHGIALDRELALHESPLRALEPGESPADPAASACPVTDLPIALRPPSADVNSTTLNVAAAFGRTWEFCTTSDDMLEQFERQLSLAEDGADARVPLPGTRTTAAEAATSRTTGIQRVLVLRVDFSDFPGAAISASEAQGTMDTNVSPFFDDSSYGLTTLTTTTSTKTYRLPQTGSAYALADNEAQLHTDARALAAADYTLADYTRIIVVFPNLGTSRVPGSLITFGGEASVSGTNIWINGTFSWQTVSHELGHTYGLYHANLWRVTDANPLSAAGTSFEYGDPFDMMGTSSVTGVARDTRHHFNHRFKNRLGWLPDPAVTTATTSGTYRIWRFDHKDAATSGQPLALRIFRDGVRWYWIGYRQNFSSGSPQTNGAYVVWSFNNNQQSQLLDLTTPGTSANDAVLAVGATFTDPAYGITIRPLARGGAEPAQYLDIEVTLPDAPPRVISAWGRNTTLFYSGNTGAAVSPAPETAVPFDLTGVQQLAAGDAHALALKADGSLVAWGDNTNGQITVPAGLTGTVASLAAGGNISGVVKTDGTVQLWGEAIGGVTTPPAGLTGVRQLVIGGGHTIGICHALALKTDGTVVGWGDNTRGQATPPDGLANVIALSANDRGSVALKADGTVVRWGTNFTGALPLPTGLAGVTALASSGIAAHTLALKSDGTVVAWGVNANGQATVPADLANVVAIAAGQFHSLAVKADGSVVAWGSSTGGKLTTPPSLPRSYALAASAQTSFALSGPHVFLDSQPQAQTAAAGGSAFFSVQAVGAGPLSYQWRRNGVALPGATAGTLRLATLAAADAGRYDVVVTDAASASTLTSAAATLTVLTTADPGRLSNLSIRTAAGTGAQTLIVGFVLGGAGTSGTKPLLIRAVGPALAAFGVTGVLADPLLTILSNTTTIATNDNWAGNPAVISAGAQLGAFPLGSTSSKDAALYHTTFTAGAYTAQILGTAGTTGIVLAEIYDGTPAASATAATLRLINVSARTQVGTGGDILITGFVVGGTTAKTVLLRAIGPTLTAFGVAGALADPKLELYAEATKSYENDNWGGSATLAGVFTAVGAFQLGPTTKDSALLVTLPPGSYTAQVSGVGGTTGVALVEVYEVP